MAQSQPYSFDDLSRRLDSLDERLHRAERERRDLHEDHRAEARVLRGRAASLRARMRDEATRSGNGAAELEGEWNGLFLSFERWIARLDERQARLKL